MTPVHGKPKFLAHHHKGSRGRDLAGPRQTAKLAPSPHDSQARHHAVVAADLGYVCQEDDAHSLDVKMGSKFGGHCTHSKTKPRPAPNQGRHSTYGKRYRSHHTGGGDLRHCPPRKLNTPL